MKSIYTLFIALATLISGTILSGCQNDSIEENIKNDKSDVLLSRSLTTEFIDVDPELLSLEDTITMQQYLQAQKRVDQFVTFQTDKFVLSIDNGECIHISERLFDHFKQILEGTNARIKDQCLIQIDDKTVRVLNIKKPLTINRIKPYSLEIGMGGNPPSGIGGGGSGTFPGGGGTNPGGDTTPDGGITMIHATWTSIEIYISYHDLIVYKTIGEIVAAATVVSGQGMVALIAGICAISFDGLADLYPNGVIIKMALVPIYGCFPYDIEGQ